MDRYPDYKFICSQAQQYEWVKDNYPPLWERIKEKISLGQFMPTGGVSLTFREIAIDSLFTREPILIDMDRNGYEHAKWGIALPPVSSWVCKQQEQTYSSPTNIIGKTTIL